LIFAEAHLIKALKHKCARKGKAEYLLEVVAD